MTGPTCRDCSHHGPNGPGTGTGACRALPPSVHRLTAASVAVMDYPTTADDLPACGLYRARAAAPAMPEVKVMPAPEFKAGPPRPSPTTAARPRGRR